MKDGAFALKRAQLLRLKKAKHRTRRTPERETLNEGRGNPERETLNEGRGNPERETLNEGRGNPERGGVLCFAF